MLDKASYCSSSGTLDVSPPVMAAVRWAQMKQVGMGASGGLDLTGMDETCIPIKGVCYLVQVQSPAAQ